MIGHPCISEQCVDFAVSRQGFGVQIECKVGIRSLTEQDPFVSEGFKWVEQAARLLKRIQTARIVAEHKVCLADIAQRLMLQKSQPGICPDARRGLEGFERLRHAPQMHQHDPAIIAHVADAVGHVQCSEVILREGIFLKCVLVAAHGLKAHPSILMSQGQ